MPSIDRSPISKARKRIVQDPEHPNVLITRQKVEEALVQLDSSNHLHRFADAGIAQDKDKNFRLNPGVMPYEITNNITKPLEINNIIPPLTVYLLEHSLSERGRVLTIQYRSDLPPPQSIPNIPILRRKRY